jgi:hypothetical protein
VTVMHNPIDMTMEPALALDGATAEHRDYLRGLIFRATGDLYKLCRDNCIGSGEVVEIDDDYLRLAGCVEQHGSLVSQPGYILVNILREGMDPKPEFNGIMHGIWGEWMRTIDGKDVR